MGPVPLSAPRGELSRTLAADVNRVALIGTSIVPTPDAKIISCHLGGSSSLCAISEGMSEANSLGMSPQSGLPHNNRVGDFDPFALPALMRATGKSVEQIELDTDRDRFMTAEEAKAYGMVDFIENKL